MNNSPIWFLILVVASGACQHEDSRRAPELARPTSPVDTGLSATLTDQQVQALVAEGMQRRFPTLLDTSSILEEWFALSHPMVKEVSFQDSLLQTMVEQPASKPTKIAQLLGVHDFLGEWGEQNAYFAQVFLDRDQESHYGPSLVLVLFQKATVTWESWVLTQQYGREGYAYALWTERLGRHRFRQPELSN